MRRSAVLSMVLLTLAAVGCGEDEAPTAPSGANVEPATEAASEPGPLVEDPTFELRATASGPYAVGQQGTFEVSLRGRGEFHVNTDPRFPFSIQLEGPGQVQFAERTLDRADAAEFSEARARFAIPFTPQQPGEHRVTAVVDFAVCTPQSCMPDQRTLALVLPVQQGGT